MVHISSSKVDVIRVKGKSMIYKQVEQRDGMIFMRLKKRALIV